MQRRGEFIFADPIQFGERERAKEIGRVLQKLISDKNCHCAARFLVLVESSGSSTIGRSKSNPVATVLSFSGALPVRYG